MISEARSYLVLPPPPPPPPRGIPWRPRRGAGVGWGPGVPRLLRLWVLPQGHCLRSDGEFNRAERNPSFLFFSPSFPLALLCFLFVLSWFSYLLSSHLLSSPLFCISPILSSHLLFSPPLPSSPLHCTPLHSTLLHSTLLLLSSPSLHLALFFSLLPFPLPVLPLASLPALPWVEESFRIMQGILEG